jgi:hypothetical protein
MDGPGRRRPVGEETNESARIQIFLQHHLYRRHARIPDWLCDGINNGFGSHLHTHQS